MTTPLESLAEALLACRVFASGAELAPEAILWCDPSAEFTPILPALRVRLPHLLCYGDYKADTRTGPSVWLRAAAARQVAAVNWPQSEPPVIYLPGYGRDVLRGAEDCPPELQLLIWFAVTGVFFGQPKQARDWTLRGFLSAHGSPVGLDVPEDKGTRDALPRAASRLFGEPLNALKGRRLDATALDGLLVPDPIFDTLRWIDGSLTPQGDPARFEAFSSSGARSPKTHAARRRCSIGEARETLGRGLESVRRRPRGLSGRGHDAVFSGTTRPHRLASSLSG
jgi:hypothetical protein